eukprot:1768551-Pleurochrysis_carterae.AAC.2
MHLNLHARLHPCSDQQRRKQPWAFRGPTRPSFGCPHLAEAHQVTSSSRATRPLDYIFIRYTYFFDRMPGIFILIRALVRCLSSTMPH